MQLEGEREFFKQFEKFLNSMKKHGRLAGECKTLIDENDKLHYKLEGDLKRIFFRNNRLLKHGKSMLNNVKNMRLSFYNQDLVLDSKIKIIADMKNAAEEIRDQNKKDMVNLLTSLLEKRVNLFIEHVNIWKDSIGYSEAAGEYAIECGKGLISIENFTEKYSNLGYKVSIYAPKFEENFDKQIKLNNEICDLLAKYDEIQDLFGKNKEFKKFWGSHAQRVIEDYLNR